MSDVFISYSRQNTKLAEALVRALESNGCSVWWDRELLAGEQFDQAIERELDRAKAVLVLWTPQAAENRWMREEASYAREQRKVIPVTAEKAKPSDLPIDLRMIQAIDLNGWTGDESDHRLELIREAVSRMLSQTKS